MRLLFVRHGEPNYKDDCLTEVGHRQAKAAAERLRDEGITRIFSSSCGRAVETARHTADLLGLPVTQLDFMREIAWGRPDAQYTTGHPWKLSDELAGKGCALLDTPMTSLPGFAEEENVVAEHCRRVSAAFDDFLSTLGYTREGIGYRATRENHEVVALFSHGGSSSVVLSHLLNLSFPYVCHTMKVGFTSVSEVDFSTERDILIRPILRLFNDCRHAEWQGSDLVGN